MDNVTHEKSSNRNRLLPLYLLFTVLVVGVLWLLRINPGIILVALFVMFLIALPLFKRHSHAGCGAGSFGSTCGEPGKERPEDKSGK